MVKRGVYLDPFTHGPQPPLHLRSWLVFARFSILSLIFSISLVGPFAYVNLLDQLNQKSEPTSRESSPSQSIVETLPPFVIPEPFPFPTLQELPKQERYTFRIPNAEFSLEVHAPELWEWKALTSDLVRFSPNSPTSPEPFTRFSFSSGCFGSCDDLSQNIAESLQRQLQTLNRQGITPRVMHWYVHHKSWVEYSILTDDAEGQALLTGVSIRWEEEWLNALRCEMVAPIDYPLENEEVLHVAWKQWIPLFVKRCRKYKVLSWN